MKQHDVFVSFSSHDRKRVRDLVRRFNAAGVSVWMDEEGIDAAQLWSGEIVRAIESCKVVVFIASKPSFESKNVARELSLASESGKPILAIYLESVEPPRDFRFQLAGLQGLKLYEKGEASTVESALRALARLGVAVDGERRPEAPRRPAAWRSRRVLVLCSLAVVSIPIILLALPDEDGGGSPVVSPDERANVEPDTTNGPDTDAPAADGAVSERSQRIQELWKTHPAFKDREGLETRIGELESLVQAIANLPATEAIDLMDKWDGAFVGLKAEIPARDDARKAREDCTAIASEARGVPASRYAKRLLDAAREVAQRAETEFSDGDLAEAKKSWSGARETYAEARDQARSVESYDGATIVILVDVEKGEADKVGTAKHRSVTTAVRWMSRVMHELRPNMSAQDLERAKTARRSEMREGAPPGGWRFAWTFEIP